MRILSQEGIGTIDLPYEQVGVSIHFQNKTEIIAYPAGIYKPDDEHWTMARYSTEAKAKRAMDMLRNEYHGYKVEEVYQKGTEYYNPIFQFPSEDKLED